MDSQMINKTEAELEKQFELCVSITEALAAELRETSLDNQPINFKEIEDNIDEAEIEKMKIAIHKKMLSLSVPLALMVERHEGVMAQLNLKCFDAEDGELETEKKVLKDFKLALEQSIRKEQLTVLHSPEMNEYLELLKINKKTMAFLKRGIEECTELEESVHLILKDTFTLKTPSGQPIVDYGASSQSTSSDDNGNGNRRSAYTSGFYRPPRNNGNGGSDQQQKGMW